MLRAGRRVAHGQILAIVSIAGDDRPEDSKNDNDEQYDHAQDRQLVFGQPAPHVGKIGDALRCDKLGVFLLVWDLFKQLLGQGVPVPPAPRVATTL